MCLGDWGKVKKKRHGPQRGGGGEGGTSKGLGGPTNVVEEKIDLNCEKLRSSLRI